MMSVLPGHRQLVPLCPLQCGAAQVAGAEAGARASRSCAWAEMVRDRMPAAGFVSEGP